MFTNGIFQSSASSYYLFVKVFVIVLRTNVCNTFVLVMAWAKLYIGVVLCVQGQCYQMKVQIYGHLLPNKFSKIKFIKFWLKNHQKSGDNLTKSIRNPFSKISILAFLPSFQLESSGNLDACTKQTHIGHYPNETSSNLLMFSFG